jgi:hypothetical protein
MPENPISLDALISHVVAQHPDGDPLQHLAAAVETSAHLGEVADHLIGHFVDQARNAGASWTDIGAHMGVTKQAVQKRFVPRESEDIDFPSGGRLSRFTLRARNTVKAAKQQAAALGHSHVANLHLLLGLLSDPDGLAAKAVVASGASIDDVQSAALAQLTPSRRRSPRGINFGRDTKKTLELSLREALRLGHNYIGTEHLLLGMLRNTGDPAVDVLTGFGVSHDGVETSVRTMLAKLKAS